jgi:succinylarginine dihydrolase
MAPARELNLDGLVGPTHSYGGLSPGNLASARSRSSVSSPREAALQGLAKMRLLADLGVAQAVLPPHPRPDVDALRRLGFAGTDARVLARAAREAPELLVACSSASAMWAANAATVSPSADSEDGRVHLTPANLASTLHRSLEAPTTARLLQAIFPGGERFAHHPPLPAPLGDEGAANHTRLCPEHGGPGVQLFVSGRLVADAEDPRPGPRRFPARQTLEASAAVARLHRLTPAHVAFARQSPAAIDAGAFHNDVVAVGDRELLLYHEAAFRDERAVLAELRGKIRRLCGCELVAVRIAAGELSLDDAVSSYLFNSQLVTLPSGERLLLAPAESEATPAAAAVLERLVADPAVPIAAARVVDLRQSMRNGGGPACLRLRLVLTDEELAVVSPGVLLDASLHERLAAWVGRHYRDRLVPADLADPLLLDEGRRALDELTGLLGLGPVYDFQR